MKYHTFLIWGIFLFTSCTSEYLDHIRRESTPIVSQVWSWWSISGTLSALPDKEVLMGLIDTIDTAKTRIWVEIYTWTEKWTLEAILSAKRRWVDVRVILEGNVYMTPRINDPTIDRLRSARIPFAYADNHNYSFTHIKTWIIDNRWCVSTGNWTYTSFTKNREFTYCSEDIRILHDLIEIFDADFHHVKPYLPDGLDHRIGLASENIRPWIYSRIESAKNTIILYNQTISDQGILDLLSKKIRDWVTVEICQAHRGDESSEASISVSYLWLIAYTSKKPYLHAKVFLIDGEDVILGSANMTTNAIDHNREILIDIWKNKDAYDTISRLYHKDCHSSSLK